MTLACLKTYVNGQAQIDEKPVLRACRLCPEARASAAAIGESAARRGHVGVVRWALETDMSPRMTVAAARYGHVRVLKLLIGQTRQSDGPGLFMAAARGGHARALRLLFHAGFSWDSNSTWAAARGGHVAVLRWLLSQGCPVDVSASEAAAMSGCVRALALLKMYQAPFDIKMCAHAAILSGNAPVIGWLHRNMGFEVDEASCRMACESRNLDALDALLVCARVHLS